MIVARTFSKIVGLAAMRLGYAIAPREIVARMRPYSIGSINVLVKHGARRSAPGSRGAGPGEADDHPAAQEHRRRR